MSWHSFTHSLRNAAKKITHKVEDQYDKLKENTYDRAKKELEHAADKSGVTDIANKAGDIAAKTATFGLASGKDFAKGYHDTQAIENEALHAGENIMGWRRKEDGSIEQAPVGIEDPQAPVLHSVAQDTYNESLGQQTFGKGTASRYGALGSEAFGKLARMLRK